MIKNTYYCNNESLSVKKIYKIPNNIAAYLTASVFILFYIVNFKSTIMNAHIQRKYKILTQAQEFYGFWFGDTLSMKNKMSPYAPVFHCSKNEDFH